MSKKIQHYWGSTDMVFQCLIDAPRTNHFRKVIKNSVKKGDIVLDLGTGTGIMSMFAVEAGAKKVYSIEADDDIYKIALSNFSNKKFDKKIILLKADATKVKIPEKVDVVICEMIATGLIDELQVIVLNHILKYCKKNCRIIPSNFKSFVELVNVNTKFYGQELETIQYEYPWLTDKKIRILSKKYLYSDLNLSKRNNLLINQKIVLDVLSDSDVNAIRISNLSEFPDKSSFGHSAAYCMPLILPIKKLRVKKGEKIVLNLNYKMCHGFRNLSYFIEKKKI